MKEFCLQTFVFLPLLKLLIQKVLMFFFLSLKHKTDLLYRGAQRVVICTFTTSFTNLTLVHFTVVVKSDLQASAV